MKGSICLCLTFVQMLILLKKLNIQFVKKKFEHPEILVKIAF